MTLQELLDTQFGPDGVEVLRARLAAGEDCNTTFGPAAETPLHVAARRFRPAAVDLLLEHGAEADARNGGGKTAYAHAARRGFGPITERLAAHGADTSLTPADEFAVAVGANGLDEARRILAAHPGVARTGNPEEDRLLADVAGRNASEPVAFLLEAGAPLDVPGLDDGTPLHVAAWFGQPGNARLLVAAGAPLEIFERVHRSSPLGWAVHGSRYSGGAEDRKDAYRAVLGLLLEAGAQTTYPDDPGPAYRRRLLGDAPPWIRGILERHFGDQGLDA